MEQHLQWLDFSAVTRVSGIKTLFSNAYSIGVFNMPWHEAALLILFSIGSIVLLYIYLTRGSKDRDTHKPGFQSNRSKSSFTTMLILALYALIWAYILYLLLSVTTVESIIDSMSGDVVIYGISNIAITYLIIIALILAVRWLLAFIVYSMVVSPSVVGFYFLLQYQSPVFAAVFVGTLLITLMFYNLFLKSIRDAVMVFTHSASAVLRSFVPISKMIFITTAVFSMQVFVIYTLAKSSMELSFTDWILLVFAFDWSITVYQYLNKAFIASAVYLAMEKKDKSSVFSLSLQATMSSFNAICSAAFVPSVLRSIRIVVENMYIRSTKSSSSVFVYLLRPVLYLMRILVGSLLYLFSFFNESIIPYIGIYGGGYDSSTAEKAMHVLSGSPVYQILNLPHIKASLSAWTTAVLSTIVLFVGNWIIAPSLGISPLPALLGIDVYDPSLSLNSLTSSVAIFIFCAVMIYSFISSVDAAVAAKVCHDYDTKMRDNGGSTQTDDIRQ